MPTPEREARMETVSNVAAGLTALRALRRAVPALDAWATDVRRDALLTVSAQEGVLPDTDTEVS